MPDNSQLSTLNFPLSSVGKSEREIQRRVIGLFRDELGYRFLRDRADRDGNRQRLIQG